MSEPIKLTHSKSSWHLYPIGEILSRERLMRIGSARRVAKPNLNSRC